MAQYFRSYSSFFLEKKKFIIIDLINYLYENGVDPNQSHGWEEYMWLEHHIKKGEFDAVHWMFQHGYDPNIKKLMTKPP